MGSPLEGEERWSAVASYIAVAKLFGYKMYFSPVVAKRFRDAGYWDEECMVEVKPVPTGEQEGETNGS